MSKPFEYRGDVAVTPLPEILSTVDRYRVPGVVTLSRQGRARRLFLDEGLVVFAASNEREAGLEAYLIENGMIDQELAREVESRRVRDGLRLGQVLLQMGVLTPERLNEAILGQLRGIVRGAFAWEIGEVVFEVGARRTGSFVRLDLSISQAIVDGVGRAGDVKRLAQRLGGFQSVLEKTSGPLLSLFSPEQRLFYETVDARTPLQQLCAAGQPGASESVRLLYTFFCLGLVRKIQGSAVKKIQYRTEGGRSDDFGF